MAMGQPAPAKSKQSGVDCCKVLRATLASPTGKQIAAAHFHFVLHAYVTALFPLPPTCAVLLPLGLDTGPPAGGSFAESVLQRSILAHAPPVPA